MTGSSQVGARQRLWGDMMGGLNAALSGLPVELNYGLMVLAPLGMAYGGAGILMCLYACIAAAVVAALAGSRAGVINGSRPGIALILAGLVVSVMETGPKDQAALLTTILLEVFACTLLAGLFQVGFGLIRLGQVIRYMPYPVLAGLTNGIALLMMISALPAILGQVHWGDPIKPLSLLVAVVTLFFSLRRPRWLRRLPQGVPALLLGILCYYLLQGMGGGAWLGGLVVAVPAELPAWTWIETLAHTVMTREFWRVTIPMVWHYAFAIAALASMEALVTATSADNMLHTRHNSDRELMAQGAGNMAAAFVGGIPTAPTLARLSANVGGGGTTRWSSIFYGVWMLLALVGALGMVEHLPAAVPAAMLLAIAIGMLDGWTLSLVPQLLFQRSRMSRAEYRQILGHFGVMVLVMVLAVAAGLMWAVGIGALSAMLVFVKSSIKPVVRRQYTGRFQHSLRVRPPDQMRYLQEHGAAVVVLELEGALFFGTTARLTLEVAQAADKARYVILDLRRVGEVDATGARTLHQLSTRLSLQEKCLVLSHVTAESGMGRFLASMGLPMVLSDRFWFADTDTALEYCEDRLLAAGMPAMGAGGEVPLAETDLTRGLTEIQRQTLMGYLHRLECPAGALLFRRGDDGDRLFIVAKGSVSIRVPRSGDDGSYARVAAFGPGVMFGEMALVDGKPRSADAVADEDTVLHCLDRKDVDRLREDDPNLAAHLLYTIATELSDRLRTTTLALRELEAQ